MLTPCRYPACPKLLQRPGYCANHASHAHQPSRDYEARRKADPTLKQTADIRNTDRWRKVRRLKLAQTPLCEDPHGSHKRTGRTAVGSQVHHIKPLATHPELAFHLSNLMSLCPRCHAVFNALERTQP